MWCESEEEEEAVVAVAGGKVEEALGAEGMDGRDEEGMMVGVVVEGAMEESGSGVEADGMKRGEAALAGCGVVMVYE